MKTFIDEKEISRFLSQNYSKDKIKKNIEKAKKLGGLTPQEVATLLNCSDDDLIAEIFSAAAYIKEAIYGKRLVFFAPLYLSNFCVNNCLYCGFRKSNSQPRKRLSKEEIVKEVEVLLKSGHKRLLLVSGEDTYFNDPVFFREIIGGIYRVRVNNSQIRRLNINIAPLSVEGFKIIKDAGIGTYQLFQETYHYSTYQKAHPSGPKSDYFWRLYAMDRAQTAGIDDIGIGALFGLYDYKFEVLSLIYHALHLEKRFSVGPHTISVPRIKPAQGSHFSYNVPYPVSDNEFKKIVAILRLAVPYTGIILTTRENKELRNELFNLGVSQISAASRTNPGGYARQKKTSSQFSLEDNRSLREVIEDVIKKGFLPSFCTACYRRGRTGVNFMSLAKPGEIKDFCLPNCLLTFKEYLLDYGDKNLKIAGDIFIEKELQGIGNASLKQETIKKLKLVEEGARDIYF